MSMRIIGSVLFMWCMTAMADTSCKNLSCNCDSIPDSSWRNQCVQQELSLVKACTAGEKVDQCQVTGVGADITGLLVSKYQVRPVSDVTTAMEQSRILAWAVRENNTFANAKQQEGDWRGALDQRKRESSARKQVFQLAIDIGAYFDSEGQTDQRKRLFDGLIERNIEDAGLTFQDAQQLWAQIEKTPEANASKKEYAERTLRNASDTLEMAADGAYRNEQLELSRQLWKQSAELSAQLLEWKQELGSSAAELDYFRQRAAARWYQSALMALMNKDAEAAQVAKSQSEALWIANQ